MFLNKNYRIYKFGYLKYMPSNFSCHISKTKTAKLCIG